MDEKMDDVEEKPCVYEQSLEIDFDYEFDVAKFYDFTQIETPEEIVEAQRWFDYAQGHAPSPLLAKLENGVDDFPDSITSSPRYGAYSEFLMEDDKRDSQVSSIAERKKGSYMQKPKSKPTIHTNCPASSRLLQPTASLLAKKNQDASVRSTRVPTRPQKVGNPPKSSVETDDTKRQKLEIGYLRKVAQLKHQVIFSHKPSKKVGTTDVNTHANPRATIPKEPVLATSHRGMKQRSKNAPNQGNDANRNGASFKATSNNKVLETQSSFKTKKKVKPPLPQFQDGNVQVGKVSNGSGMSECGRANSNKALQQEKSDHQGHNSKDHPLTNKIVSGKGDIDALQKRETNAPRESKTSISKKKSQDPPTELFSKLSLNPKNDRISSIEAQTSQPKVKVLEKNTSFSSMKENKNPNAVKKNSTRCSRDESRMIEDIVNHLMSARSFTIC